MCYVGVFRVGFALIDMNVTRLPVNVVEYEVQDKKKEREKESRNKDEFATISCLLFVSGEEFNPNEYFHPKFRIKTVYVHMRAAAER